MSEQTYRQDIRNVAIIAHVDHGKTSLVDALLKQSKIFRDNQAVGTLIMDSNDLEREKGITILAKNTAVVYRDIKINIIDTPGHSDFSGEVERVLNMADGCLLVVDSVEGPMSQTKFVLRQAMMKKLRPVVVINKIDRENARVAEVVHATQDLFLELAADADQLDFPIIYTSAREGYAVTNPGEVGHDMVPLFECILKTVPPPRIEHGPFQMLVSNLDYDNYRGRFAIGRIFRGKVAPHDNVMVIDNDGQLHPHQINEVYTYMGLQRLMVPEAPAGDIVAITGLPEVKIGETITSPEQPEALPGIHVGEPTVKMTFGVNTSPFAGREGRYCTSRQLRERLFHELETNISLRVEETEAPDVFLVSGRGELHLSVLIETMRREGYEFQISKPEAITKFVDGKLHEPVELLTIDTREESIGAIMELLSKRQGRMINLHNDDKGGVRLEYNVPTRGLIGFRSIFLTSTRGEGIMNTLFLGYEPWYGDIDSARNGALVAVEEGMAVTYGLNNAQGRGITFIEPGTFVYQGMIVGLTTRENDIVVNVCKEKKMTNVRASTSDFAIKLVPPLKMSLEQSLDFINQDELVEVTPQSIRLRKKLLTMKQRSQARHSAHAADEEED